MSTATCWAHLQKHTSLCGSYWSSTFVTMDASSVFLFCQMYFARHDSLHVFVWMSHEVPSFWACVLYFQTTSKKQEMLHKEISSFKALRNHWQKKTYEWLFAHPYQSIESPTTDPVEDLKVRHSHLPASRNCLLEIQASQPLLSPFKQFRETNTKSHQQHRKSASQNPVHASAKTVSGTRLLHLLFSIRTSTTAIGLAALPRSSN